MIGENASPIIDHQKSRIAIIGIIERRWHLKKPDLDRNTRRFYRCCTIWQAVCLISNDSMKRKKSIVGHSPSQKVTLIPNIGRSIEHKRVWSVCLQKRKNPNKSENGVESKQNEPPRCRTGNDSPEEQRTLKRPKCRAYEVKRAVLQGREIFLNVPLFTSYLN